MHSFYNFDEFVVYKLANATNSLVANASERYHKKTRLNTLSKSSCMASLTPCAAPHLHHPHLISSHNLLAGTKNSARSGRSSCSSQNKRQRFCTAKLSKETTADDDAQPNEGAGCMGAAAAKAR
jgi:hypothetical protein